MPRDSGGSYTLPNPPAVDGTVASAAWINGQLGDVAAGLSDSLSRSGQGGLLSALKYGDGSVSLPAITFTSEPASGLYRVAANILALVIAGAEKLRATLTGVAVTGTLGVSGAATVGGTLGVSGAVSVGSGNDAADLSGSGLELTSANALVDFKDLRSEDFDARIVKASGANLAVQGTPLTVLDPVASSDAATKGYVDAAAAAVVEASASFDINGGLRQNHGAVALSLSSHPSAGTYVITCAGLTASAILLVSLNAQYNDTATITYTSGTTFAVWIAASPTGTAVDRPFSVMVLKR